MQIKMIIDCGAFKKDHHYDVSPKKATMLLTRGLCVRINDPLHSSNSKKVVSIPTSPNKKAKKIDSKTDKA